jgi:hypothetical protein
MSWKLGEIYAVLIAENARRITGSFVAARGSLTDTPVYRDTLDIKGPFYIELGDGLTYEVPESTFAQTVFGERNFTPVLALVDRLHRAVAVPCKHIWGGDSCMRCNRKMCELFPVPPNTEPPASQDYWVERENGEWYALDEDELEAALAQQA